MARADDEIRRLGAIVLQVFLARLVFIEPVAAQAKAERKIGGRRAVPRSRRGLEGDLDPLCASHLAEDEAAERHEVDRGVVLARSDADNHQPGCVEAGGRQDVECAALGGAKVGRLRCGADEWFEIAELRRHRGSRFHVGPHEDHQRAAFGGGQGPEGDLNRSAHNRRMSLFGFDDVRPADRASPVAGADISGGLRRSSISRRDWATHLSRFGSNIASGSRSSCNERAHGASAGPGRGALMRARRISGRRGRDDSD